MDLNILLFNNEIYGLTKGQYSPTSHQGLKTKSSPLGSIDYPFNPLALALGADASFIARSMDRDPKHLRDMMRRTAEHKGTSLLEVYQNCPIFNDGVFEDFTDKKKKNSTTIYVEHQQPLIFGEDSELGIRLDGLTPEVVNYKKLGLSVNDLMIHDEKDLNKANLLTRFFDDPAESSFPRSFGVIYAEERPTYEDLLVEQIENAKQAKTADLNALLAGSNFWEVK